MALTKEQNLKIKEVIKEILLRRIESFPSDSKGVRNAPFHELILKCFEDRIKPLNVDLPYLVAISSWLHGLNTSLGTGFENLAHIISKGYKRSFAGPFGLDVKESQAKNIDDIIKNLKSGKQIPDLAKENSFIFDFNPSEKTTDCLDFTADNYIETDEFIEAIELKSVRPNSGEGRGEKQKILYGKAAFKLKYPNKDVRFYVGFPFDPTSDNPTDYNKERFLDYLIEFKKFFSPNEILLSSELWDHLSGSKKTMEEILDTITSVIKEIKRL